MPRLGLGIHESQRGREEKDVDGRVDPRIKSGDCHVGAWLPQIVALMLQVICGLPGMVKVASGPFCQNSAVPAAVVAV